MALGESYPIGRIGVGRNREAPTRVRRRVCGDNTLREPYSRFAAAVTPCPGFAIAPARAHFLIEREGVQHFVATTEAGQFLGPDGN
jgi:hypothetical protein